MKKNVFVLALASMFIVGNAFGQDKKGAEKTTTTEQTQEKPVTDKTKKKEKNKKDGDESASDKAKETTDKMTSELGLNAQQQQQAMQTNSKYFNSIEEMKNSAGAEADKTQMQAKKDQLNEQRMSEFKSYLTPDQYRKLENKAGASYDETQPSTSTGKADKKAKAKDMTPEEQERLKERKQENKTDGE